MKATFAIVESKVGGKMRSKQDRAEGTDACLLTSLLVVAMW